MSADTIDAHARHARAQAQRLLHRAQAPVTIRGSTLALGAFLLFTASVVGGFAFRAWQIPL
jgi:hypothetical protein